MNDFQHLAGMGSLKAWLTSQLPWIKEGGSLAPRSIVLTGLPGTGKHSTAKAIAAALGKPLAAMDAADDTADGAVLQIDDPSARNNSLWFASSRIPIGRCRSPPC